MMRVRTLASEEEFERYADFGGQVYEGNPCWRPPDRRHLIDELAGRVAQADYSDIQGFWVERDGRMMAVVTAVLDRSYIERWKEPLGHLVNFEALPGGDAEVEELFGAACSWLRERGCRAARFEFLLGWQMPPTIDAYECVPTVFHTYNPPYYHRYLKNAGFWTEKGCVEYRVRFSPGLAARYRELAARAEESGVSLRPWDFARLEEETTLFHDLVHETFARHWGAPPWTPAVTSGLTRGLRPFLVPEYCWFARAGREPAGFVYSLPDLHQPEAGHGVLLIIGVREAHRGKGINLALGAKSFLAMMDRGCRSASYTLVLDDNWPSRRTAEKLGCRVERNFVIYRKDWA